MYGVSLVASLMVWGQSCHVGAQVLKARSTPLYFVFSLVVIRPASSPFHVKQCHLLLLPSNLIFVLLVWKYHINLSTTISTNIEISIHTKGCHCLLDRIPSHGSLILHLLIFQGIGGRWPRSFLGQVLPLKSYRSKKVIDITNKCWWNILRCE